MKHFRKPRSREVGKHLSIRITAHGTNKDLDGLNQWPSRSSVRGMCGSKNQRRIRGATTAPKNPSHKRDSNWRRALPAGRRFEVCVAVRTNEGFFGATTAPKNPLYKRGSSWQRALPAGRRLEVCVAVRTNEEFKALPQRRRIRHMSASAVGSGHCPQSVS